MLRVKRVRCPYCLDHIWLFNGNCRCTNPNCGRNLDFGYVWSYSSHPALFIPLIGMTNVGKTVYLQVLMLALRQINRLWKNSSCVPVDENTSEYLREVASRYDVSEMPKMTSVGVHYVYSLYLQGIDPWKDATLVFRDLSGEYYERLTFSDDVVAFLSKQATVFMMLKLSDVMKGTYQIDELLYNYVHTRLVHQGTMSRGPSRMVVILSQADAVDCLPDRLNHYLRGDTVWSSLAGRLQPRHSRYFLQEYMRGVRDIDRLIQLYLAHELAPITALADNSNTELHFSIISSLGSQPRDGKLVGPIRPMRILDPLLWAFEYLGKRK